jgi:hypothetical protein
VKALSLCVLALFAAALAATVEPGRACSCAPPDPRSALARADAAFVGTLIKRRQLDNRAVLVYTVEKSLKGPLGQTVEVVTARDGAGCGIEAPVGTRVGLTLDRRDGAWHGHLCAQFAPDDLLAAAALPAPNGRGPVALLVGGRFGPARTLALDAKGRTLAYGLGAGYVEEFSMCPGGRHLAEIVGLATGYIVAIREVGTLRLVRQQPLRSRRVGDPVHCVSASGEQLVVFLHSRDIGGRAQLVRITPNGSMTIWRGRDAGYPSFRERIAYVQIDNRAGTTIVAVDLRTGAARKLGTVPVYSAYQLIPNPAGTRLAGNSFVDYSGDPRLLVIDLERRPASVRTIPDPAQFGDIRWLRDGRFAYFGGNYLGRDGPILVYSSALRLSARVSGWKAGYPPALVGSTAYGLSFKGALQVAKLPSGPVRIVRRLPGAPSVIVSATG